ncbi:hypothetical protein F5Y19DRAFT_150100 [Xylariaceae sp. FL1651]|nr:hypothetical protein F5Y19DRAFT_150100 [Xylariaceae sp. FL1651]
MISTFPPPAQSVDRSRTGLGIIATTHKDFQKGVPIVHTLVPAMEASKLLSASFWEDATISRKSDNHFHMTSFFGSITENDPSRHIDDYRKDIVMDRKRILDVMGQLNQAQQDMIRDWEMKDQLWKQLRQGWYAAEEQTWHRTPWSWIQHRAWLTAFGDAVRKNDLTTAANMAKYTVNSVDWSSGKDQYIASMQRHPAAWAWHAIGLLMNAAMPIRHDKVEETKHVPEKTLRLYPSSQAVTLTNQAHAWHGMAIYSRQVSCDASVLYDPLFRDGQTISNFEQTDYLDVVRKLILFLRDAKIPISLPWLGEISRVAFQLQKHWTDLRTKLQSPWAIFTWAPWDFTVPDYDPYTCQVGSDTATWDPN